MISDPVCLLNARLGKPRKRPPSDLSHPSNSSPLTRAASKESKQSELKPPVLSNQLRSSCLSTTGGIRPYTCPDQGKLTCLDAFKRYFGGICTSITKTESSTPKLCCQLQTTHYLVDGTHHHYSSILTGNPRTHTRWKFLRPATWLACLGCYCDGSMQVRPIAVNACLSVPCSRVRCSVAASAWLRKTSMAVVRSLPGPLSSFIANTAI